MSEAHPLTRHPLYGVPCPPPPNCWTVNPKSETAEEAAKNEAFFAMVVDWLLVNYAYREGDANSRDGVISLVDGSIISLADMRTRMAPWALQDGTKKRSPVNTWLHSTARLLIHREEMRPDKPWPIFVEDDCIVFNHYRPAAAARGSAGESGGGATNPALRFLPGPMVPLEVAARFFADTYTLEDGNKSLHYWRGSWWHWARTRWCEVEECEMRAEVYRYAGDAVYLDENGALQSWAPNDRRVSAVLDALTSVCLLATAIEQPSWLDERVTGALVPCANGIYDLDAESLLPHSPLLFNVAAAPFDYDPTIGEPAEWNKFTAALWPNSPESIDRLEEWMGYVISGQTYLHKIFLLVGPPRGGRGTIGRILSKLLGAGSVCGPTFKSLGGEFGLMPFIGRSLAIVGDARFAGENVGVTVERLLSISGEDTIDVNRKGKAFWTGKLPTRIMILSNELPKLTDASAAIIGRMVPLLTAESWAGREDHQLQARLERELPGILNRALAGLRRLNVNGGKFTYVESADAALSALEALASPVRAFVREKCELGADYQEDAGVLYRGYKSWCEANGHAVPSSAVLGKNLFAAYPKITKRRLRVAETIESVPSPAVQALQAMAGVKAGEDRKYVYAGIRIARGAQASKAADNVMPFPGPSKSGA